MLKRKRRQSQRRRVALAPRRRHIRDLPLAAGEQTDRGGEREKQTEGEKGEKGGEKGGEKRGENQTREERSRQRERESEERSRHMRSQ